MGKWDKCTIYYSIKQLIFDIPSWWLCAVSWIYPTQGRLTQKLNYFAKPLFLPLTWHFLETHIRPLF